MADKSLSSLWKAPRLAREKESRKVNFLELFYNLVFVVIVTEIAHLLASHPDMETLASFVFLFIMVWFLWFNAALYHNMHGYDDVRTRTYAFIQMGLGIIGVVAGLSQLEHITHSNGILGGLGFLISFSAWWIYFDASGEHKVKTSFGWVMAMAQYLLYRKPHLLSADFTPLPYWLPRTLI